MNLLLGISGGIAAYKTPELIRLLIKNNINVKVVATKNALNFVTPTSLATVSNNHIYTNLFDNTTSTSLITHIELAKWADIILILPATANIIAKYAHGICDDLLTTILLASEAKVILSASMNKIMWANSATQNNIAILKQRNIDIINPDYGDQICGDVGYGRLPSLDNILTKILTFKDNKCLLKNIKILLTAGSTREMIDPVRYISSKSSGKMAFALADEAINLGANVTIIKGITSAPQPNNCNIINITSSLDMLLAVKENINNHDIFISCAAVSDYTMIKPYSNKIKKTSQQNLTLQVTHTTDILSHVASNYNIFTVGFAAETENIIANAKEKLFNKKIDLIIANDVSNSDIGFESDYNEVYVIGNDYEIKVPKKHKTQIAQQILPIIYEKFINT